jgi:nicotinamide riboside transporter PnuC
MEYIGWLFTIIAIIGTYINAKGNRLCFYLWVVSNVGFIIINVATKAYPQAALFTFNLAMCVVGLRCWRTQTEKGRNLCI